MNPAAAAKSSASFNGDAAPPKKAGTAKIWIPSAATARPRAAQIRAGDGAARDEVTHYFASPRSAFSFCSASRFRGSSCTAFS